MCDHRCAVAVIAVVDAVVVAVVAVIAVVDAVVVAVAVVVVQRRLLLLKD